jgi:hypothetical protein
MTLLAAKYYQAGVHQSYLYAKRVLMACALVFAVSLRTAKGVGVLENTQLFMRNQKGVHRRGDTEQVLRQHSLGHHGHQTQSLYIQEEQGHPAKNHDIGCPRAY